MELDRISCHTSVRKVYERIKEDGMAMHTMLLRNFMGASTYHYQCDFAKADFRSQYGKHSRIVETLAP
ncbi:MAG TPA: hypothetical protein PKC27_00215 [Methanomethylovorans sp.]|uniref:hypothetical protein n=1 Tax=Methanomethylovorans sp. TaxID=2758717 RepID=UPI002C4EB1D9|nr:hypothetical protein [Methanomethylovorans sp.]